MTGTASIRASVRASGTDPDGSRRGAALVWFRRDLRLTDHAALQQALQSSQQVYCLFVFDREILDELPSRADRRVEFIRESLQSVHEGLREGGGGLIVAHAQALRAVPEIARVLGVSAVFCARDYEPLARRRDDAIESELAASGRALIRVKDQILFEPAEVLTGQGRPFSVFTPYRTAWLRRYTDQKAAALQEFAVRPEPSQLTVPDPELTPALRKAGVIACGSEPVPSLTAIGFEAAGLDQVAVSPGAQGAQRALADFLPRMARYREARDFPSVKGPSYLSVHLRFGTVSVRELFRAIEAAGGGEGASTWQSELIWREFYFQVLFHHPGVVAHAFKPAYDAIAWEEGPEADALFEAWCEGRTGYPLVDAAMLQLNRSGYLHNRLRMVTASFLTKDLGIDWRRGERYFARQLLDFDLAANNGGWQWAASTGCDAQPYFRIFNPVSQSERFDPEGRFIKRYLPALERLPAKAIHAPWLLGVDEQARLGCVIGRDYPAPLVDHGEARARTLARYAVVKSTASR